MLIQTIFNLERSFGTVYFVCGSLATFNPDFDILTWFEQLNCRRSDTVN